MARILIVEDNPDNMKLFRSVLRFKGHEVIERSQGEGLSGVVMAEQPDLILLDIQLPGRDGFALLRDLRSNPITRPYRIVALTAHAMAGDRERALDAGFDEYITKPIDVMQFPEQIRKLLERSP